jgi:hypothetical protein
MSITTQLGADVRFQETDLSQTLIQESADHAAIVLVSAQGRSGNFLVTSPDQFLAEYGPPNAQVSFGHYCALDFLREGNTLWVNRVLGAGAEYSGVFFGATTASPPVPVLTGITDGIADPINPAWTTLEGANTGLVAFYPKSGAGSYGNTLAVRIKSNNINAPATPSHTPYSSGGTLGTDTYAYRISAISLAAETLATTEVTETFGAGSANSVKLTWTAVAGAVGYNIYGRSSGTETLLTSVGGTTLTWTDDGSLTPGATVPITNPANVATPVTDFTVEVFNTSVSSSNPIEIFNVSMTEQVDNTGVQMEITQRINPFSQFINVASNAASLMSIPTIYGWTAIVNLLGGESGAAPSNGDIQLAWADFSDRETVDVDLLINGGYTDVGIQQTMDSIATSRSISVALLDMPQTSQNAQQMIDYRNLTLNLNSSYSAIFGPDVLENDPYNGRALYVPFSGWAAALCARTDRVAQPWYAIAGLNRGIVNVLGVRNKFTEGERTLLFKSQINFTRNFTGQGIALWEQTTMQAKASALSWLSIRRLVNVIKKSTYKFLLYSVHEPNDDFTRQTIVGSIGEYLEVIKNARGISGYLVVSNDNNNPPSLYNAGILNVAVFITPIIPVHQLQVDIIVTKQGVTFSEINISQLG